eukprot:COSAG06_NODE_55179_length_291_cov_0.385417_1_plen_66_part_10
MLPHTESMGAAVVWLQLQQCSQASDAQAWSLVPVTGSSDTFTVQMAKAFVQSQKCTVWNICPVDSS